jgi:hypothetical protein
VQGFWGLSDVFHSLLAETIALYYNFIKSLYSFQQTLNKDLPDKESICTDSEKDGHDGGAAG